MEAQTCVGKTSTVIPQPAVNLVYGTAVIRAHVIRQQDVQKIGNGKLIEQASGRCELTVLQLRSRKLLRYLIHEQ